MPGIDRRGELLDDRHRVHRTVRQGRRQPLADGRRIGARAHVAIGEAGEVVEADLGGAPQGALTIIHRADPTSRR